MFDLRVQSPRRAGRRGDGCSGGGALELGIQAFKRVDQVGGAGDRDGIRGANARGREEEGQPEADEGASPRDHVHSRKSGRDVLLRGRSFDDLDVVQPPFIRLTVHQRSDRLTLFRGLQRRGIDAEKHRHRAHDAGNRLVLHHDG